MTIEETALDKRLQRIRNRKSRWLLFRSLAITAVIVYLIFGVFFRIAIVQGNSMVPALKDNDIAMFLNIGAKYQAGDIALIKDESNVEYVKRIVALPGQTVNIDDETGQLIVDGKLLSESYIYEDTYSKNGVRYPITLGENEYFALGDHRENSKDSRNYGAVTKEQLDGKLLCFFRIQKRETSNQ